jgi:hypothetical protein
MAVKTNIAEALQDKIDSKAAIKSAIIAKGVTVENELLSDYAGKVEAISQGVDTSDATATADDLMFGKTAYVDGAKITGAGALWQHVKTLSGLFLDSTNLPESINIYAPNARLITNIFRNANGVKYANITFGQLSGAGDNSWAFYISTLVTITLNSSISGPGTGSYNSVFRNNANLESILGTPLDCANATSFTFTFTQNPKLKDITFAQSTIKASVSFVDSPLLTTESLLSIGNGLNAGTPNTLTMHATSKTNMNNINVDNIDGVAVLGSAMTLTAFINNIKGWTIA